MEEQERRIAKVQGWLEKGERDLAAARKLASGENTLLDYAAFHCQQAAEKAVKAVLVFYDVREKEWCKGRQGHDISYLIQLAEEFDPNIGSRARERNLLTPLASKPRYPNFPSVTREEFDEFLHNAEGFYEYILSFLEPKINLLKEATNDSA